MRRRCDGTPGRPQACSGERRAVEAAVVPGRADRVGPVDGEILRQISLKDRIVQIVEVGDGNGSVLLYLERCRWPIRRSGAAGSAAGIRDLVSPQPGSRIEGGR